MGQISTPAARQSLILTATDRLVATNADGGLSPAAAHIVLLGENAGQNLGPLSYVYVIGASSLAGGVASATQTGTTVYGGLILSALTNATPPALDGPIVAMGYNIAPAVQRRLGSSVLIGANVARLAPALISDLDGSVIIGNESVENQRTLALNGGTLSRRSVILGWRAARGASAVWQDGSGTSLNENVLIGAQVAENCGADSPAPGTVFESNVVIGTRAFRNVTNAAGLASQQNVAIGNEVGQTHRSGQRNVWIGANVNTPGLDSADDVIIGAAADGAHTAGGNFGANVVIGARGNISGLDGRCIFLGAGANSLTTIGAGGDHFLVETVNSTTLVRRNLVYGNMGTLTGANVTACGLVFGLSGAGNRDLPGMNIVKLINGNRDAGLTAPVGGGYFYSSGGELHWVSTGNVDYALTPGGGLGVFTVATLPVAPAAGTRAFVSDALAPAFTAAVVGGGAVFTPVYFDGAAWLCG